MKKILFFAIISVIGLTGYAQNTAVPESNSVPSEDTEPSRLDFNVGLETSHLWRGLVINDGMTATGNIHYTFDEKKNFTVGIWGGAGFDGKYREINYYVQYQKNNLSIGIWDLFNTTGIANPEVFNYNKLTTTHLIDLRTSYRFPEAFPIRLEVDVLLYSGLNDRQLDDNNVYKSRYSTYTELSYPVIRNKKVNLNVFLGAAFALDGNKFLYTNKEESSFGIVNTGIKATKNISVFNYKLPVSATAMWNPENKIARVQLDVNLF